jgi:hypothetical protein
MSRDQGTPLTWPAAAAPWTQPGPYTGALLGTCGG